MPRAKGSTAHCVLPMVNENRLAFETAVWTHYRSLKTAGWSHPEEGDPTDPAALFWRQPSGKYGVRQIEAAWCGWQLHASFVAACAPTSSGEPTA